MRKNPKTIALALLFTAGILAGSQVFSTEVPALGCKYTGNPSGYCVYGKMWVFNCCNTTSLTTCAYELPPID